MGFFSILFRAFRRSNQPNLDSTSKADYEKFMDDLSKTDIGSVISDVIECERMSDETIDVLGDLFIDNDSIIENDDND